MLFCYNTPKHTHGADNCCLTNVPYDPNRYASLLLAGREQLYEDGSSCGREKEPDARMSAQAQWNTGGAAMAVNQLELAVRDGSHRAAFVLATVLLSGLDGTVAYDGALEGMKRERRYKCTGRKVSLHKPQHDSRAVDFTRAMNIKCCAERLHRSLFFQEDSTPLCLFVSTS